MAENTTTEGKEKKRRLDQYAQFILLRQKNAERNRRKKNGNNS